MINAWNPVKSRGARVSVTLHQRVDNVWRGRINEQVGAFEYEAVFSDGELFIVPARDSTLCSRQWCVGEIVRVGVQRARMIDVTFYVEKILEQTTNENDDGPRSGVLPAARQIS